MDEEDLRANFNFGVCHQYHHIRIRGIAVHITYQKCKHPVRWIVLLFFSFLLKNTTLFLQRISRISVSLFGHGFVHCLGMNYTCRMAMCIDSRKFACNPSDAHSVVVFLHIAEHVRRCRRGIHRSSCRWKISCPHHLQNVFVYTAIRADTRWWSP